MGELAEIEEWAAVIDARIEPIATRPVDLTDADWMRNMQEGPRPLDEVGIRPEAEAALRDVLVPLRGGRATSWSVIRRLICEEAVRLHIRGKKAGPFRR
ncbi:hypothetical protein ACWDBP_34965 [Streptomyces sp. NPDC001233]|uniref:hypothetical protein n=1 Tax=Streptomyces sp. NPDC002589 TaxID=3154420 RepID=UPI0033183BD3